MAVDCEYFVASASGLTGLDLAKRPATQLPTERVAELPGVDPRTVLLALVEVLSTRAHQELVAHTSHQVVFDGGDDGPWVTAVADFAVETIQGADGDPELEWDDTVTWWAELIGDDLAGQLVRPATTDADTTTDAVQEALHRAVDELRRLCGDVDATHRLYCWSAQA